MKRKMDRRQKSTNNSGVREARSGGEGKEEMEKKTSVKEEKQPGENNIEAFFQEGGGGVVCEKSWWRWWNFEVDLHVYDRARCVFQDLELPLAETTE